MKSIIIIISTLFTFSFATAQTPQAKPTKDSTKSEKKKHTLRDKLIDSAYINKSYKSETDKRFNEILLKSFAEKWKQMPIGERMGNIGMQLLNVPYIGGTLEVVPEECTVVLDKLDCVTYFENVLAFARILKYDNPTFKDLVNRVRDTRYRNGKVSGYTSRLHYTSDWIYENTSKKIVADITKDLGGIPFPINVGFMSQNPKFYDALKKDPTLVPVIKKQEEAINKRKYFYIPKDKVKAIESKLKTGDIIAITTSNKGLDYSHTGMVYKDKQGVAHFLHASSAKKKVMLDVSISEYLATVKSNTGITVLRPL